MIPLWPNDSNWGYSLFSFTRAFSVVNCQSALAWRFGLPGRDLNPAVGQQRPVTQRSRNSGSQPLTQRWGAAASPASPRELTASCSRLSRNA